MKKSIKIKSSYKRRTPHKPTKVHKDRTKYTRKGKSKDRRRKAILAEIETG